MQNTAHYASLEGTTPIRQPILRNGLVNKLADLLASAQANSALGNNDPTGFIIESLYPESIDVEQLPKHVKHELGFLREEAKVNPTQVFCLVKYIRVYFEYLKLDRLALRNIGEDFLIKLGRQYYHAKECYQKNRRENSPVDFELEGNE